MPRSLQDIRPPQPPAWRLAKLKELGTITLEQTGPREWTCAGPLEQQSLYQGPWERIKGQSVTRDGAINTLFHRLAIEGGPRWPVRVRQGAYVRVVYWHHESECWIEVSNLTAQLHSALKAARLAIEGTVPTEVNDALKAAREMGL